MIYANGLSGTIGRHLIGRVNSLDGNLRDSSQATKLQSLEKVSALLHLAAAVGAEKVERELADAYLINVRATVDLGQIFKAKKSGKFVFFSTSHVYAKSTKAIREDYEVDPQNQYAAQKLQAEMLLTEIFKDEPERLLILRVFSVLGWDVPPFTLGGALKKMTLDSSHVLQNGDDVRDFLNPRQIANIALELSSNSSAYGIVNLCSGEGLTVSSAARQMFSAKGLLLEDHRILPGHSSNPIILGKNAKLKSFFDVGAKFSWSPT